MTAEGPPGSGTSRGAAIVTGAARGIGHAVALALSASGHHVVLVDPDPAVGDVADACGGDAVVGDAADAATIDAAVAVAQRWGGLRLAVNNAGLARHGALATLADEDIDRMWRVNVRAAILLSRAAFRVMPGLGGGTLVNIVSTAALRGEAGEATYCATKFALRGLTESLCEEGRPLGIRVVGVYPAGVDTSFWTDAVRGGYPGDTTNFLRPEHVAAAVVAVAGLPAGVGVETIVLRHPHDADVDRIARKTAAYAG